MAIGISPAKLEFYLKKGETAAQKIFLQNLDESPTKVSLAIENPKYDKQLAINRAELILPGKQIEEVEVRAGSKRNFETEIQIQELARTEGTLAIASGVKIPVSVKVENSFSLWVLLLALALAVLTTAVVYFLPLLRRKGGMKRG